MRDRAALRRLLGAIAGIAERVPISASEWTLLGALFGFGAAVAIAVRVYPAALILGLLCTFCDIADGAIARARGSASGFGRLLDVTVDKYVEGAIVIGTAIGAPPLLGMPAYFYAALAIWGAILISLISNVGEAAAGGRRPAHPLAKLFGRAERGLFFGAGVGLAWASGDERWLTGLVLGGGALLSHATALALAAGFLSLLREEGATASPPSSSGETRRGGAARGPAARAPG